MSTEPTTPELDCRTVLDPGQRRMLFAVIHVMQRPDAANWEVWQSYIELAYVIVPDDPEG